MRVFTYTFKKYKSKTELAAALGTTRVTLRKSDEMEEIYTFQKLTNQYLMMPRRYARVIVTLIDQDKSHIQAQLRAKCMM
jgi:hypothetical protein